MRINDMKNPGIALVDVRGNFVTRREVYCAIHKKADQAGAKNQNRPVKRRNSFHDKKGPHFLSFLK
jgi:hypothetical protein